MRCWAGGPLQLSAFCACRRQWILGSAVVALLREMPPGSVKAIKLLPKSLLFYIGSLLEEEGGGICRPPASLLPASPSYTCCTHLLTLWRQFAALRQKGGTFFNMASSTTLCMELFALKTSIHWVLFWGTGYSLM